MGGGAADERQRRVVPRVEPTLHHHQLPEMASLPIPDELLVEILLRLPTPDDLVRASAASVSFRRVAADRIFLRRYRKLHAPPLLGFLEESKFFHPAAPAPQPYPSGSAASAVAVAADFSFSFLPAPARKWFLRDIRDGRVLLSRYKRVHNSTVIFPEVVVCDPLHRRYLLLPPIPDDLAATVEDPFMTSFKLLRVQTFLVPTSDDEEAATADETSFSVIWMAQCKAKLFAFVFSSNTQQWGAVPPRRWIDLSSDLPWLTEGDRFSERQYVYGCFYWIKESTKLLVLDIKTMEFSIAKFPPVAANDYLNFVMVEAGEGKLGMLVQEELDFVADIVRQPWDVCCISYFIRQNNGGSSSQWQKVKATPLDFWPRFVRNMEKYPLLCQGREDTSWLEARCFKLDIETFQLEKVCSLGSKDPCGLLAYRNFPPSLLSTPIISSGVEKNAEKEMLEQECAASSGAESPRSG